MKLYYKWLTNPRNFLLIAIVVFILLRIPSLIEPMWYGDEGIYAAVAHEMKDGELLYRDTWDHKTPGIFYFYLAASYFGDNQVFVYKLFNLLIGLLTLYLAYRIAKLLFKKDEPWGVNATVAFTTVFLGSYLLEGNIFNAENIFICLATLALFLYLNWQKSKKLNIWRYGLIGLVMGIALLMKIHPLFDALFIGLLITLEYINKFLCKELNWKQSLLHIFKYGSVLAIFTFLPLILFGLFYYLSGNWEYFWFAVWKYNQSYSEVFIKNSLGYIVFLDNLNLRALFIGLIITVIGYFYTKGKISYRFTIAIIWLIVDFFAVKLSSRPYAHYLLQMLLPAALLTGIAINKMSKAPGERGSLLKFTWILLFGYMLANLFTQGGQLYFGYLHPAYYPTGYRRIVGLATQEEWNDELLRAAILTDQLAKWLEPYRGQEMFMYINEPWVYVKNDIKNPVPYTVYFHIDKHNVDKVVAQLQKKQVKYMVLEDKRGMTEKLDQYIVNNYTPIDQIDTLGDNSGRTDPKEGVFTLWIRKDLTSAHN